MLPDYNTERIISISFMVSEKIMICWIWKKISQTELDTFIWLTHSSLKGEREREWASEWVRVQTMKGPYTISPLLTLFVVSSNWWGALHWNICIGINSNNVKFHTFTYYVVQLYNCIEHSYWTPGTVDFTYIFLWKINCLNFNT